MQGSRQTAPKEQAGNSQHPPGPTVYHLLGLTPRCPTLFRPSPNPPPPGHGPALPLLAWPPTRTIPPASPPGMTSTPLSIDDATAAPLLIITPLTPRLPHTSLLFPTQDQRGDTRSPLSLALLSPQKGPLAGGPGQFPHLFLLRVGPCPYQEQIRRTKSAPPPSPPSPPAPPPKKKAPWLLTLHRGEFAPELAL